MDHGWSFDEERKPTGLGPIQSGALTVELQGLDKDREENRPARELFNLYKEDAAYVLTAIREGLGDQAVILNSTDDRGVLRLSPKKMVQNVSTEEWIKILDAYYQLKKEEVQHLIGVFKDQDQYRMSESGQTMRDYFVGRIEAALATSQNL